MANAVRLAPTWRHALRRTGIIVLTAAVIAFGTWALEGTPSAARARPTRATYGPTWPVGLAQLVAQGLLLGVVVVVGRRWLRVRL